MSFVVQLARCSRSAGLVLALHGVFACAKSSNQELGRNVEQPSATDEPESEVTAPPSESDADVRAAAPEPSADIGNGHTGNAMEDSGPGVDGTSCVAEYGSEMVFVPVDGKGKSFCIDATEATNADYALFLKVGAQPALPENCAEDDDFTPRYGFAADTLPMVGVDWCDAYAYCSWAGKRLCGKLGGGGLTEYGYSRPDRSEWSLACTNYGTSDYPYGTEEDRTACAVGDLYAPVTLHPVGSLPSCEGGPTGVFDMVGNVQEWENATIYDNGVYILGGSYRRGYACDTYVETTVDIHGDDIGFRCCKDPE